jgi:hypothetical protein
MRFEQSRLKIDRANHHIAELESRLTNISDQVTSSVEINPNGGNEVIKYDFDERPLKNHVALAIGDIVHNLKCALDYTWPPMFTKAMPGVDPNFSKFPVHPTADSLKDAFKGMEVNLRRKNPAALSFDLLRRVRDFLVCEIQPYDGGDFAIWPVHYLNRQDKHRLLTPIFHYSGVRDVQVENEMGKVESRDTWGTDLPFPYYLSIAPGWRVKDKGKPSVTVMFQYGETGQESRPVDTLRAYSCYMVRAVERLEDFFDTLGGGHSAPPSALSRQSDDTTV